MELKDYFGILRRRWIVILGVFVGLQAAFFAYSYWSERPTYSASARVGIRDERRPFTPQELQFAQYEVGGYGYYTKEALLSSRQVYDVAAVIYLAVKGRKFDSDQQKKRWWREWQSEPELARWIEESKVVRSIKLEGGRISSIEVDEEKVAAVSRVLQGVSSDKPDDRMQLLRLSSTAVDPEEAMLQVNSVAKGSVIYSRTESIKLLDVLDRNIRTRTSEVEAKISELSRTYGPIAEQMRQLERRLQGVTDRQAELDREIESREATREQNAARARDLLSARHVGEGPIPGVPDSQGMTSVILEKLRGDIVSLQTEMRLRSVSRTADSPEMRKMGARIEQLQAQFRDELDSVRSSTLRKLEEESEDLRILVDRLIVTRAEKAAELDALKQELAERDPKRREVDNLTQELSRYRELATRVDSVRALQQGYYTIEDVATEAGKSAPRWPRLAILLALVAAVVAIGAGFLVEYADAHLYSDFDVRRYLNVPCIALIEDAGSANPLIVNAAPRDPLSENFNVVATLVRTYLTERNFKILSVCSAIPREGKTTVACNLAVALARKGLRVALVDADLRIPQVHQVFPTDNATGLSNILRGEIPADSDPEQYMKPTSVENLRILPSGPTSDAPAQVLESPSMADVMRRLRETFDVVIFDTPPITSVGDALSLARLVDTNLMVIGSGLTNRRVATWAKQLMSTVRADICGAILNFTQRREGASYYYYYYYSPGKSVRSRE